MADNYIQLENSREDQPVVECPKNVELEGKIDHIQLAKVSFVKMFFFLLGSILSCSLLALLSFWLPKVRIRMTLKRTQISQATRVVVFGADGSLEVKSLKTEGKDPYYVKKIASLSKRFFGWIKTFEYRLFKYIFVKERSRFIPAQFSISGTTYSKIHEVYGRGLDDSSAGYRHVYFGPNLTDIPRKSCLRLFVEEMLSPFYVFQIFSIFIWSLDTYIPYAALIALITLYSVLDTLWETRRNVNKLRNLAYYECPVTVFRNEAMEIPITISSSTLVPGDIFIVPENAIMPCDAVLLNGSCIMNESMLTGESIPVVKNSLPYSEIPYNIEDDKQYTLFAGTRCIQTRYYKGNSVLALVIDTGFATVKGELIRTMLFPKPSNFKFYIDSFKFLGVLAFMAIVGFAICVKQLIAMGGFKLFIKGAEIITVTVPPALPACMAVGINYGLTRLKTVQISCISPNKINEAGKIQIMCFDKTGTLTEDGLDILGVRTVLFDKNNKKLGFRKMKNNIMALTKIPASDREEDMPDYIAYDKVAGKKSIFEVTNMLPDEHMFEIMSTCHSLTIVDGKLIGDPLDVKMFETTSAMLEENPSDKFDNLVLAIIRPGAKNNPQDHTQDLGTPLDFKVDTREVGIIRRFEFSSKLQRMSVVVKHIDEAGFRIHIKGSPEKIRELCRQETVPSNFHKILDKYSENGYRVLAVATKPLNVSYKKVSTATRDDFEKGFTFIGLLVMENRLKPITTSIINTLKDAHIKTIMVTGDNILTAISVARQCHIVQPHQRVFLGDLSEKKIGNEYLITWRDFERGDKKLDANNLNPKDADEIELSYAQEEEKSFDTPNHKASSYADRRAGSLRKSHKMLLVKIFCKELHSRRLGSMIKLTVTERGKSTAFSSNFKKFKRESEQELDNNVLLDTVPPFFDLEPQDYTLAVTGKAFAQILREVEVNKSQKYQKILRKMLSQCSVYARMLPDQKALMITHLQTNWNGTIVGMCGDGANDCGALKAADVGISLSEAEASIAAPFTSKIQDISCILNLLRYGRAALVTSFQTFKYIALYSVIQFTSLTILYYHLGELTNAAYYYIDIFLIIPLSAAMSVQDAHDEVSRYQPGDRLVSWPILSSFIGQSFIQIIFQIGIAVVGDLKYATPQCASQADPDVEDQPPCYLNTALFVFSNFQYTIVALVFNEGKPFRKSFYQNKTFTFLLVIMMISNIYLTTNPVAWVRDLLAMSELEAEYLQYWILPLVLLNSILTFLWDKLMVRLIVRGARDCKQRKVNIERTAAISMDLSNIKRPN